MVLGGEVSAGGGGWGGSQQIPGHSVAVTI